ncbi:MAG: PSD1 and planctomycete cytochrome C domain-containing protein [Pirellulales bacterium]
MQYLRVVPILIPVLVCFHLLCHLAEADEASIDFSRDVLPILSDRCFHCHGPDPAHREAELRLDERASSIEDRGDYAAIQPGNASESELILRILTEDESELMPPPDSHKKKLTAAQVDVLRRWINSGAEWGKHWAFEKPKKVDIPDEGVHPVDYFIQQKLTKQGLSLSPKADKYTLARRLSFDLTGLPPTPEVVQQFVESDSDNSSLDLTNQLLQSQHYGERMAMWWLDVARYADTDGYQGDRTRTNWPWRDWVVNSFNTNQPFDQFTTEQFAGDLLPDATEEQKLATCFHRNHMTNGEGGRDPEESRIDYVIDRVSTTGTVWLGLTLGCAQCHSHKFDPISQAEFYSLNAFFNSIDEDGKAGGGAKPYLSYQSKLSARAVEEAQQLVDLRKPLEELAKKKAEAEFIPWLSEQIKKTSKNYQGWKPLLADNLESTDGTVLTQIEDGTIIASGPNPRQDDYLLSAKPNTKRITGFKLEIFPHESHTDGKLSRGSNGEFVLTNVKLQLRKQGVSQFKDIEFSGAIADVEIKGKNSQYGKVRETLDDDPRKGWTTQGHDATVPHTAIFALAEPLYLSEDEHIVFVMFHRSTIGDGNIGRYRLSFANQPGDAVRSLSETPLDQLAKAEVENVEEVDPKLRGLLLEQYLADHTEYQKAKGIYDRSNQQLAEVKRAAGKKNVMVLAERKEPRKTHVLVRGVWDKKGEEVGPKVPAAILDWPADKTQNRLELSNWIVSKENPLTARVMVNHLWQMYFGVGIVRTPEDFGLQGERPTHLELLDWLAVELMENDWDIQHIIRLIVTSETYQQSSVVSDELKETDPENKLFARGSRFRLPSWMLRDAALQSSGLLNPALGGPTVRPYQPPGIWKEMFMGAFNYQPSEGPAQYRRTLYAFWRRASAPTFLFDSAQRRVCQVQVMQTNTPLQALTLLNDHTMLESAKSLAIMAVKSETTDEDRIQLIYQRVVSRNASAKEIEVLNRELERFQKHYKLNLEDAIAVLEIGQPELLRVASEDGHDENEISQIASYMMLSSMILNLDEAITHE